MAGTPTTNYNIPTYADTDAPDLSGAYNDAMGIIDTQLKANADAIESASTGNYTGTAPITVDNEGRTIGVRYAAVSEEGAPVTRGAVDVTGVSSNITSSSALNGTKVPNLRAVADYVAAHGGTTYTAGDGIAISGTDISSGMAGNIWDDSGIQVGESYRGPAYQVTTGPAVDPVAADAAASTATSAKSQNAYPTVSALKAYVESKMAAAGAAYTGTAPVVVDNGSHTIRVSNATPVEIDTVEKTVTPRTNGIMNAVAFSEQSSAGTVAAIVDGTDGWPATEWGSGGLSLTTLNVRGIQRYVAAHTPDASTSVKGLVQLAGKITHGDNTKAITGAAINNARVAATNHITVQDLANYLYYDPDTSMVFYKPTA